MNAWTDEEIEILKTLAAKGKSARVIAEGVGPRHTKNSVIGKAHRLGISLRGNCRPPNRSASKVDSPPRIPRAPQKVDRFVPVPVARTFRPKPSPISESPHVPWEDHEDWMCGCMYDDRTWCSGQKARVTVGHRTHQSNWCEFHRRVFTMERGRKR